MTKDGAQEAFFVLFERGGNYTIPLCDGAGRIVEFETQDAAEQAAMNTHLGRRLGFRVHAYALGNPVR